MSINNIIDIGRQGMNANRRALETSSNNIANANTEGYSRQRTVFETESSTVSGGVRSGRGVKAKEAIRIHDVFVENQILQESRGFGAAKARSETLRRVQDVLSHENFRMGDVVNDFFNRVREMAANPDQAALKMGVLQSANNTASAFREMHASLDSIRADIDKRLETEVNKINRILSDMAKLNEDIGRMTIKGNPPHDLLDRRDKLLRDAAQKLGLQALSDERDQKTIAIEGAGILVAANQANKLVVMRTEARGNKAAGSYELFLQDNDGLHAVGKALKSGELAGLMQIRDEVVTTAIKYLDRTAHEFARRVNEVHREGVGSDGFYGDKIFEGTDNVNDSAHFMKVNEKLLHNPGLLASGYDPEKPGDNRIALKLADIQNENLVPGSMNAAGDMASGPRTLNEGLNMMVGEVGVRMEQEEHALNHQAGILQQLNNYRESISGVNLEEEAMNMMQYQTVFNASARAMKVGGELLETIIKIADF